MLIKIILWILANILPYFVKYVIGYCNFYYQLGYGVIFYIYFFRRYKAKKKMTTFYGNSISNWILLNISFYKKFIFTQLFVSYFLNSLNLITKIHKYVFSNLINNSNNSLFFKKIKKFLKTLFLYTWTPLFKKSSYISFVNLLKRFNKRK